MKEEVNVWVLAPFGFTVLLVGFAVGYAIWSEVISPEIKAWRSKRKLKHEEMD